MSNATNNDAIQAAVVTRTEQFVKETVRILAAVHIGTLDANFEPLFQSVFHMMVDKYTQEVS